MSQEIFEDNKLTPEEQAISSRRAFAALLPLLNQYRKPLLVAFGLLIAATLLGLTWPVLLKRAFDVNISSGDYTGLIWTTVAITLMQGATLALQYFQRIKLEIVGQDVMLELKQRLFSHTLALDVSFFDRHPVGRLMARVESDTEALRMMFTTTAVALVGDLLLITGTFAVMLYYSWRLTLILVGIVPIVAILMYHLHPDHHSALPRSAEEDGGDHRDADRISARDADHPDLQPGAVRPREIERGERREIQGAIRSPRSAWWRSSIWSRSPQYLAIGLVLLFGIGWSREGTGDGRHALDVHHPDLARV